MLTLSGVLFINFEKYMIVINFCPFTLQLALGLWLLGLSMYLTTGSICCTPAFKDTHREKSTLK